jgi:hypothetical protein
MLGGDVMYCLRAQRDIETQRLGSPNTGYTTLDLYEISVYLACWIGAFRDLEYQSTDTDCSHEVPPQ